MQVPSDMEICLLTLLSLFNTSLVTERSLKLLLITFNLTNINGHGDVDTGEENTQRETG